MTITPECILCLYQQALRSGRLMGLDEATIKQILDRTGDHLKGFELGSLTPPQAAVPIYGSIAELTGQSDPIAAYKEAATKEAATLLPKVHAAIKEAADPLDRALRAAIAGNVLDFGAQQHFDFETEIERVFEAKLAVDDYAALQEQLKKAKKVLVLGDNAGEHLFDGLLLEQLALLYPDKALFYAVRGAPAINDVTLKEARAAGLDTHAQLLDSGVDTPGLVLSRASAAFKAHYDQADLILAKGMGNYECLEAGGDERIFFLFKVKCSVVSAAATQPVGSLMRMRAQSA
jgi:uncharacterized protein with ATP-grasp and redox domains